MFKYKNNELIYHLYLIVIDIEFSAASLKDNLGNLKEAVLQALPEIQDNFDQIEPEKRTLEMKSIIQARLKTIRQQENNH